MAVNILGEEQADLAVRFARHGGEKFEEVPLTAGEHGQPLLSEAVASLVCRVTEQISAATHFVFLAEVDEATASGGAPLTYFRGQFGRIALD
jgi:flavin reductase (DIM6/NTAB) family NADH-FMN oxidoreductase RutF